MLEVGMFVQVLGRWRSKASFVTVPVLLYERSMDALIKQLAPLLLADQQDEGDGYLNSTSKTMPTAANVNVDPLWLSLQQGHAQAHFHVLAVASRDGARGLLLWSNGATFENGLTKAAASVAHPHLHEFLMLEMPRVEARIDVLVSGRT